MAVYFFPLQLVKTSYFVYFQLWEETMKYIIFLGSGHAGDGDTYSYVSDCRQKVRRIWASL